MSLPLSPVGSASTKVTRTMDPAADGLNVPKGDAGGPRNTFRPDGTVEAWLGCESACADLAVCAALVPSP